MCSDVETLSKLHQTKPTAELVVLFLHGRIVNRSNQESPVSSIWTSQLSSMSRTMLGVALHCHLLQLCH